MKASSTRSRSRSVTFQPAPMVACRPSPALARSTHSLLPAEPVLPGLRHENRPARPRPDPIHCVYLDCVGDELFRTEGDAPGLTAWTGLTVRSRRLREYKYNLELAEAAAAPEPQVGCAATGTRDAWTSCKHCSPILLLRNLRAVRLVRPAASRAQAEPGHDNVVIAKRVGR